MRDLAPYIDYTLLRPGCTRAEIQALCQTALERGYAAVCVPPYYVSEARQYLPQDSSTKIATVIGFPHGMHLTEVKRTEALLALQAGTHELDMVINLGAFFSGDEAYIQAELATLTGLAEAHGALLKVILETAYLTSDQVVTLCQWCAAAGAHYVKTSTGFAPKGAEEETVRLMRQVLPPSVKVKASGGIRSAEAAWRFIQAGADRIGTSSTL